MKEKNDTNEFSRKFQNSSIAKTIVLKIPRLNFKNKIFKKISMIGILNLYYVFCFVTRDRKF